MRRTILEQAAEYDKRLTGSNAVVVPFDNAAARVFAKLRQDAGIKAADAIQLSCASIGKCDLFVTNDDRLSKKNVPGVQFITSLGRVPL